MHWLDKLGEDLRRARVRASGVEIQQLTRRVAEVPPGLVSQDHAEAALAMPTQDFNRAFAAFVRGLAENKEEWPLAAD